jgi:hypothetical protein
LAEWFGSSWVMCPTALLHPLRNVVRLIGLMLDKKLWRTTSPISSLVAWKWTKLYGSPQISTIISSATSWPWYHSKFRQLCNKLYLKGRTREIDRVLEAFSKQYIAQNPGSAWKEAGESRSNTSIRAYSDNLLDG